MHTFGYGAQEYVSPGIYNIFDWVGRKGGRFERTGEKLITIRILPGRFDNEFVHCCASCADTSAMLGGRAGRTDRTAPLELMQQRAQQRGAPS